MKFTKMLSDGVEKTDTAQDGKEVKSEDVINTDIIKKLVDAFTSLQRKLKKTPEPDTLAKIAADLRQIADRLEKIQQK